MSTEFTKQFARLLYKSTDGWSSIPEWARFYLELGASLANFHEEKIRYVAALALPTRSYTATFIGSGLAYANSFLQPDEIKQHLELILSLPNGSSVKYLNRDGRLLNGIKREVITVQGKLIIGIQKGGIGKETIYIASEDASRIEISNKKRHHLPNNQIGRNIRPPSPLLDEILAEKSYEYVFQTRIDGLVIGSFNSLEEEAKALMGIGSEDGTTYQGFLFELFRVHGFNPPSSGHRFLLQAANSQETIKLPLDVSQSFSVMFDGSLSFTKWKEYFKNENWIVLLDHTEANFKNAVSQINQEYIYRTDAPLKISLPPIPSGIEMMFFGRDV